MEKDFINIHGPEHHFLDGAAFLAAYRNAGGELNLEVCLDELANRTITMPGAMCGYWGICGSVASVGAALSVIHGTSPLSTDGYYKDNMEYTSSVINRMAEIGGARCCKRNAFLALSYAVAFVKDKYGIPMDADLVFERFQHFDRTVKSDARLDEIDRFVHQKVHARADRAGIDDPDVAADLPGREFRGRIRSGKGRAQNDADDIAALGNERIEDTRHARTCIAQLISQRRRIHLLALVREILQHGCFSHR